MNFVFLMLADRANKSLFVRWPAAKARASYHKIAIQPLRYRSAFDADVFR